MLGSNRRVFAWGIAGLACIAAAALVVWLVGSGDGNRRAENGDPFPSSSSAENGGEARNGEDRPNGTTDNRAHDSANDRTDEREGSENDAGRAEEMDVRISTVELESEIRDYEPGEPVYFSDSDVRVFFNFRKNESGRISAIKDWYPEAAVYTESGGERIAVSFERTDNDHERISQLMLELQSAPPRDVHIELIGADGRGTIRQTLKYAQPFHYDIRTEDRLQQLMAEARAADESFNLPWRFGEGKEVRLEIVFTAPANRESAEARFADIFGGHAWKAEWRSNREAVLVVTFDTDAGPRPAHFDLSGIRSEEGHILVDSRTAFQIYPEKTTAYGRTDAATGERTELFRAPYPYIRLLPNGDGTLALAQLNERTEAGPSWYVLLDLQRGGEIIRSFPPNGIEQPQWVGNGRTFVYAGRSVREPSPSILQYDADTDATTTLWTSPSGDEADRPFHWLQPIVAPGSEAIWILDYRTTSENYSFRYSADLYELSDNGSREPRRFADIMQGVCEGALCYGYVVPISDRAFLYWQRYEEADRSPYGEYRTFELSGGQTRQLLPDEDLRMIPLDGEDRFLVVQSRRIEESQTVYDYSVYDAVRSRSEPLFQRDEAPGYSIFPGAVPYGPNQYLIGDGWRSGVIDVAKKTYTTVRFELLGRTERYIYWREWPDGY